jgi:hypothetical protein
MPINEITDESLVRGSGSIAKTIILETNEDDVNGLKC